MNKPKHEDSIKIILSKIRPDIILQDDTNLIEENIIDSVDVIEIVVSLEKHFSINIDLDKTEPKHFESVSTLSNLVEFYLNDK